MVTYIMTRLETLQGSGISYELFSWSKSGGFSGEVQFKKGVGIQKRPPITEEIWPRPLKTKQKKEMAMMYLFSEEKAKVYKERLGPSVASEARALTCFLQEEQVHACPLSSPGALPSWHCSQGRAPYMHWLRTWLSTGIAHKPFIRTKLKFWVIKLHVFPSTFWGGGRGREDSGAYK